MISVGIDCGSKNTKIVIMKDKKIISNAVVLTDFDEEKAVKNCLAKAIKNAEIRLSDIDSIIGTGSGRKSIKIADDIIGEIEAIAKGAYFFFPNARTAVDVGAEYGRAVKIDENGNASEFSVNEKCASGAGYFIEDAARILETSIEDIGLMCLTSEPNIKKDISINAQCAIFLELEIIRLILSKTERRDIGIAVHNSVAKRIASMIMRIGVTRDVIILGGVGCNPCFVEEMKQELKLDEIFVPDKPEYGAAVGAAIIAGEIIETLE